MYKMVCFFPLIVNMCIYATCKHIYLLKMWLQKNRSRRGKKGGCRKIDTFPPRYNFLYLLSFSSKYSVKII